MQPGTGDPRYVYPRQSPHMQVRESSRLRYIPIMSKTHILLILHSQRMPEQYMRGKPGIWTTSTLLTSGQIPRWEPTCVRLFIERLITQDSH